jgi:hypothetical protein
LNFKEETQSAQEPLLRGPREAKCSLSRSEPCIECGSELSRKRGFDEPWRKDINEIFRAFVLHWLLFVNDNVNAALRAYRHAMEPSWAFNKESVRKLIGEYEKEGEARFIPRQDALCDLRNEVENGTHILRPWADRFTVVDRNDEYKPGEALRVLSTRTNRHSAHPNHTTGELNRG